MVSLNQKIAQRFRRTALFAAAGFFLAGYGMAQSLPDGPGKATLEKVCTGCHGISTITHVRAPKDQWESTVSDMASRGAEATDAELDQIVQYLATNFGPETPASQKTNVNKASSELLVKNLAIPQSDADAIVRYREKNGNFKNLEALESVPGIDSKKIEQKKDLIEF